MKKVFIFVLGFMIFSSVSIVADGNDDQSCLVVDGDVLVENNPVQEYDFVEVGWADELFAGICFCLCVPIAKALGLLQGKDSDA